VSFICGAIYLYPSIVENIDKTGLGVVVLAVLLIGINTRVLTP
jgi:hypothetical protein